MFQSIRNAPIQIYLWDSEEYGEVVQTNPLPRKSSKGRSGRWCHSLLLHFFKEGEKCRKRLPEYYSKENLNRQHFRHGVPRNRETIAYWELRY